jgi:hypothetical protein
VVSGFSNVNGWINGTNVIIDNLALAMMSRFDKVDEEIGQITSTVAVLMQGINDIKAVVQQLAP